MERMTRHELKRDQLRTAFEHYEEFIKQHYREILTAIGIIIVVLGAAAGLKLYNERQEATANVALGQALKTFRARVGPPAENPLGSAPTSFASAEEKYKKAAAEFLEIMQKYPRQKAADIALYHLGLCQAQLGDHATAAKTLEQASRQGDRNIAALAKYALAGELTASGKQPEAAKLYQDLAAHPTMTVPRTTALLALAETYRAAQPSRARQTLEQVQKESGGDPLVAELVKDQLASLPK